MFSVGLTHDFLAPDGRQVFDDIGLAVLEGDSRIRWEFLPPAETELAPEQVRGYDALIVLAPRVTARSLREANGLALIARFGVGYDSVDVDQCTAQGIALTITPDGVRRPMATSILLFVLALSHQLPQKDRLVRDQRWGDKASHVGTGLTGRTLGSLGLGNIAQETFRLVAPLEMRPLACDPYVSPARAAALGIPLVDLPTLLRESDFVCLNVPLSGETYHLIGATELQLMKPTAYLINTARGPIVDEAALVDALRRGGLRGAALDTFEQEPTAPDNPLLAMDNVILAPHAIGWTDELFRNIGRSACRNVARLAHGELPEHVVNRDVLTQPAFRRKVARWRR